MTYHYIIDPQSLVLFIFPAEGEAFWKVMWGILAPLVILVGLKDERVSHFYQPTFLQVWVSSSVLVINFSLEGVSY